MANIVGIGTDCVDINRFRNLSDAFLKKVFTEKEIEYCTSKKSQAQHFAGKFAAKEAAIKSIKGLGEKVPMNKIEVLNDDDGAPAVSIQDKRFSKYTILLSVSHSDTMAIAFSISTEK